jgi:DNA-binding GntR family transcriptional regulator
VAETKYREIAETLAVEIAALPPGSRLEGEHAIAARFGVGRSAARAALQELERRLLVRRVKGRGTFTAQRVDYTISAQRPPSWSETLRAVGARPRTVVRRCEPVGLPEHVAARIERPVGSPAYVLNRRSFTDDLPASWGAEWIPADLVPELPAAVRVEESLHTILRQMAGVDPVRGWVRASMEVAQGEVADELGLDVGSAVWFVESLNRDGAEGPPVCLTQRWIRADAIRVVFEAGPPSG